MNMRTRITRLERKRMKERPITVRALIAPTEEEIEKEFRLAEERGENLCLYTADIRRNPR